MEPLAHHQGSRVTGMPYARYTLTAILVLLTLVLYGYGARTDRVFDAAERQAFLAQYTTIPRDAAQIRTLAEAYWRRNPAVARDKVFGRNGSLGIFGAGDHYARHGKREGRVWGLSE